jgi:hypothetical protein
MLKTFVLTMGFLIVAALSANSGYGQTSRRSFPAAEVNGTFRYNYTGKFRGSFSEIKILALGGGRLRVAMDLTYPYELENEVTANEGTLDGEATIKGDTAVYSSKNEYGQCEITIRFVKPGLIKVKDNPDAMDCGFGNHVYAGGTYHKVSGKKPTFDNQ